MPKRRPIEWRNKFKRRRRNGQGMDYLQVGLAGDVNTVGLSPNYKNSWRWNRTPEEIAREREDNRIREHVRRLNRTPEEVIYEREQNRLREQIRRANRTPEQVKHEREQNRIREQLRRLNRTPEQIIRDREQSRIRQHLRRSHRTPEEVELERKQNRVRERLRRCNRTPDEIVRDREENRIRGHVLRLPPPPPTPHVVERNLTLGSANVYLNTTNINSENHQSPCGGEFEWFNEYLKLLGYNHTCVCYQCSGLHCFAHANCMKDLCVSNGNAVPRDVQTTVQQHSGGPEPISAGVPRDGQTVQQHSGGPEPISAAVPKDVPTVQQHSGGPEPISA